jgi:hypothetical protein
LLLLVALAWGSLTLPVGWSWIEDGSLDELVPDQTAAAALARDIGLVVREEPVDPWRQRAEGDMARTVRRLGDLEGFVSADFLLSMQRMKAQEVAETLYQGPTDSTDPVSRWVYVSGDQAWWRLAWREGETFHQVMAWAPRDKLPELTQQMRALEEASALKNSRPAMLGRVGGCSTQATISRAATVRQSRRWTDAARAVERRSEGQPSWKRSAAELAATGFLVRAAESCMTEVAASTGACAVYEGEALDERSLELQERIAACMDGRERLPVALGERLDEVFAL